MAGKGLAHSPRLEAGCSGFPAWESYRKGGYIFIEQDTLISDGQEREPEGQILQLLELLPPQRRGWAGREGQGIASPWRLSFAC